MSRKSNRALREAFKRAYQSQQKVRYQIPAAEQDSAEWKKLTGAEKWKKLTEAHQDPPEWKELTEAQQELAQEVALLEAESEAQRARDGGRIIAREKGIPDLTPRETARRLQAVRIGPRAFRQFMRAVRFSAEVENLEGRPATAEEIAKHLDIEIEKVDALRPVIEHTVSLSPDEKIEDEEANQILDALVELYTDDEDQASRFPSPLEAAHEKEARERTQVLFAARTEPEREAVLWEHGDEWTKSRATRSKSRQRAIAEMKAEAARRGWKDETPAPRERQSSKWGPEYCRRPKVEALRRGYHPRWRQTTWATFIRPIRVDTRPEVTQ